MLISTPHARLLHDQWKMGMEQLCGNETGTRQCLTSIDFRRHCDTHMEGRTCLRVVPDVKGFYWTYVDQCTPQCDFRCPRCRHYNPVEEGHCTPYYAPLFTFWKQATVTFNAPAHHVTSSKDEGVNPSLVLVKNLVYVLADIEAALAYPWLKTLFLSFPDWIRFGNWVPPLKSTVGHLIETANLFLLLAELGQPMEFDKYSIQLVTV